MSIFSTIDKDAKSAFTKFEAEFKKLWAAEPKVEATVVSIITEVAPEIVAVAAVVGGAADATAANAIIGQVKTGLAAVQAALNAAGAGASTNVKTVLQSVVTNLQGLLAVAGIKDATTLATVTKDVDEIIAGLQIAIAAL